MQPALRQNPDEYWRPPRPVATLPSSVLPESFCRKCAAEFAIGARFCHVCGYDRETLPARTRGIPVLLLDFDLVRQRLGLGVPSMLCLLVGFICLLMAALTGVIAVADAVPWQAKTAHLIEWLLAGIGAFLAGVLVKK